MRPWDQFLTYCRTVAQHRGGQLWAAQLSDPRWFPLIRRRMAEQLGQGASGRPGLEGHTGEVAGLYMVANEIRLLIQALAPGSNIGFIEGPLGPEELIKKEDAAASNALVDAALGH